MGGLASAAAFGGSASTSPCTSRPRSSPDRRRIQIGCNAMKVLRELGLEPRLRQQSFYPRSWNNRDRRTGEVKFDMVFGEAAEQKFGAPYLLAHRGDLHAALASVVPDQCIRLSHNWSVSIRPMRRSPHFCQWRNRGRGCRHWRRRRSFNDQEHDVWRRTAELYRAHRLSNDVSSRAAAGKQDRRLHQVVAKTGIS